MKNAESGTTYSAGIKALNRAAGHFIDYNTTAGDSIIFSRAGPLAWPHYWIVMLLLTFLVASTISSLQGGEYYSMHIGFCFLWPLISVIHYNGYLDAVKVLTFIWTTWKIIVGYRAVNTFPQGVWRLLAFASSFFFGVSHFALLLPKHAFVVAGFCLSMHFFLEAPALLRRAFLGDSGIYGYEQDIFFCGIYTACTIAFTFGYAYILQRRRICQRQAALLAEIDGKRYEAAWKKLQENDTEFTAVCARLEKTYCEIMESDIDEKANSDTSASTSTRLQPKGLSFGELFFQADRANLVLQHFFHHFTKNLNDSCSCKVRHECAAVKSEARALQKYFRTYGRQYAHLCDLVRTSLVFDNLSGMVFCLEKLAEHPEILILKNTLAKCRFTLNYDSQKSGGYRDVQLSIKLRTKEAFERGIENHICEVQLQLRDFRALKTDGGHRSYVIRRNLMAE